MRLTMQTSKSNYSHNFRPRSSSTFFARVVTTTWKRYKRGIYELSVLTRLQAFKICDQGDLVPEQVFLLGRMGDNKRALNLIIERLADVNRAIDFAKEQNDDDLWEDLFKYSETRPGESARLANLPSQPDSFSLYSWTAQECQHRDRSYSADPPHQERAGDSWA